MIFDILSYPFMQRAFVAGGVSALLLGALGTYIVSRRMSFLGDGLAHASLAGVALAILLGWAPLPVTLAFSVVLAFALFLFEEKANLSSDMAIGIIFTTGMAMGVILLHFYPGYQPELVSYLFGNILAVTTTDLLMISGIGFVVLLLLFFFSKRLTFVIFDPEGAFLSGLNSSMYILLLYIFTAIAIVLSIRLLGIALVSALLILPAALSRMFTRSFRAFQAGAVVWSLFIVCIGLLVSYVFDLPSGAAIVVFGSGLLTLLALVRFVIRK